jgi:hypothetical protein
MPTPSKKSAKSTKSTKKSASSAAGLPKGALSLTYNLMRDLKTQADFQSNRTKVMNAFGLDKRAQALYERCGQLGKPDDVTMVALMALGLPELRDWRTTAGASLGTAAKDRKGPLSLLYHLIFDKDVKANFIKDPESVMTAFGLDDGTKQTDQKYWFRLLHEETPAWDPRLVGVLTMASYEVTAHYNDPW